MAIGGLLAPAWSLNIEAMPATLRATSVTIIMLGFSLGGGAASQVSNLIAPTYGWEGVFFVCGALTFALAIGLQFTLPRIRPLDDRQAQADRQDHAAAQPLPAGDR